MRYILEAQHASFTGGSLLFSDEEVDTLDVHPVRHQEQRETQAHDLVIYDKGDPHFEITVVFRIARYDSLLRLYEIFQLQDEFSLFPHLPDDAVTNYTVVWIDPNNFIERWRRGYPRANYTIEATFREPRGSVCVPPS